MRRLEQVYDRWLDAEIEAMHKELGDELFEAALQQFTAEMRPGVEQDHRPGDRDEAV